MARSNQYNPNQAGLDILAFCQKARKELIAKIDPSLPLEKNIEARVEIMRMDDNELRKALIAK